MTMKDLGIIAWAIVLSYLFLMRYFGISGVVLLQWELV